MAFTKIQIISLAFTEIGKDPINDISEAGKAGAAIDLHYDLLLTNLLTGYPWRFSTTQVQLVKLTAEPLKEWQYAYQLPADYLAAIDVIPHSDYKIFEKYIYSNLDELFLEYRFKPETPNLPGYFVELFKFELAKPLARFATVKREIKADIDKEWLRARNEAISIDQMSYPNRIIKDSKVIDSRYGS
ncbi:MAG: hypothetical protein V3V84_00725 [Candidatus Bathyarchaeia archaeon]